MTILVSSYLRTTWLGQDGLFFYGIKKLVDIFKALGGVGGYYYGKKRILCHGQLLVSKASLKNLKS